MHVDAGALASVRSREQPAAVAVRREVKDRDDPT
jgi:hypothetical protein